MKILFVSKELSGGDLCYRLVQEGHNVKLYVHDKDQWQNLDGMVKKTDDWKKELKWVGKKNGLIVFDTTGYGSIQDGLRRQGYSVVGGCALGDRLEDNRHFGKEIMDECGIKTLPSHAFHSLIDAMDFARKEQGQWVVKQNGHASKIFNYVGQMDDASDVIEVLKSYQKNNKRDTHTIELQERVRGVEIGVARYFNGVDWVGPIEMNIEHKSLHAGGVGPKTFEMGTLMWYDDDEENPLFQETLVKMKDYLCRIGFHGDIDINCIVNKDGIFPLELTARLGFPATQLQTALNISPWGEFLKAVADGQPYDLKYRKGFGIIVLIATPPFPYVAISRRYSMQGVRIFFNTKVTPEEMDHIHFEEVSKHKDGNYYISGSTGFVLHVSAVSSTVEQARQKAYALIDKIIVPKKFYRNDIGVKFIEKERELLTRWGYLKIK